MKQEPTKEIKVFQKQSNSIIEKAEDLTISKAEEMEIATDYRHQISVASKKIKEAKELYTKPANEILKNARAMFSPLEMKFKTANDIIKKKMEEFNERQEKEALKEIEEIEKKVKEGSLDITEAGIKLEKLTPNNKYQGEIGSTSFRTHKEIRITNETLIPREYLVLNEVKIRKDLLAGKKIKGCELVIKKIAVNK